MKHKIGFIDEDERQVFHYQLKLEDHFEVIGYDIEKGMPLDDLLKQVYESDISLLMVDYFLVDKNILAFNGDEVVRRYEEIRPKFPMIIFTNEEGMAFTDVDNPNIIYNKGMVNDEKNLDKLTQTLQKNIQLYEDYISKRKTIIADLLTKNKAEKLNAKDQHVLTQAQFELQSLDKWAVEAPMQLLTEQKIEEITDINQKADEFLTELKKKSKNVKK